jgi:hypothetical protein
MRISRVAGMFLMAAAFAGCNAILGNEDGHRLVGEAGTSGCHANSECPSGQACLFEACSPTCTGDADCEDGSRCLRTDEGTACVTSSAAQCSGATCPSGTTCSRGTCRTTCTTGEDCAIGQGCVTRATATVGRVCVGTDPDKDPDAPQPDGGAGGAPSSGGAGGQTASGGRSTSSGGSPVDAGEDASGPCVATGAEVCFNDRDDDCNGKTDCEDPACTTQTTCVPESPGATLGVFIAGDGACPAGYSPVSVKRGITAEYGCTGCSCVPNETRCESGVYGHGPYPCPSYQYSGLLYNVFSDRCGGLPADTNLHYFDVRGFTVCTPQGTGTPNPPTWTERGTFCAANQVGGGCPSGNRCVPKITTNACAMSEGTVACGARYPTATGEPWYTSYTDTRQCLACSCSFGTANCAGGYIAGYTNGTCTGAPTQIGSGAQGDACGLGTTFASGKVIGTPTSPRCDPNTPMNGELTPNEPKTICCGTP